MNQSKIKRMVEEYFRGQYIVEDFLGAGGFADVYLTRHKYLSDRRAMKINKEPLQPNTKIEGIFEEARLATLIRHQNVISIHDAGIISIYGQDKKGFFNFGGNKGNREEKYAYFIMEYVAGGDLWKYWKSFRNHNRLMPIIEVIDIMKQICIGLNVLHSNDPNKIIHRDLKPQNLMVEFDDGKPLIKITDFGLAKETANTMANVSVAGTPLYMAPECYKKKFSTMSDIYAVGVIFYQLLTNRFPFELDNYDMYDLFAGKPWENELELPSHYNSEVTPDIDDMVAKCLSMEPRQRYANAGELLDTLNHYMDNLGVDETTIIYTSQSSSSGSIYNSDSDDDEVEGIESIVTDDISETVEESLNRAFALAKQENKLKEAIEILERLIISDMYIREKYTYRLRLWKDEMPDRKLIDEAFKVYSENDANYSLASTLLEEAIAYTPSLRDSYEGYIILWDDILLNLSKDHDLDKAVDSLEELINQNNEIKKEYGPIIDTLKTKDIDTIEKESLKLRRKSNYNIDNIFKASKLMEFIVLADENKKDEYSSKLSLWKRGLAM